MKLEFHRGDRNGLLLLFLIATLVFSPYMRENSLTRYVFNLLLTGVMVLGALSAARTHGRVKLVGVGLAVGLLGFYLYTFTSGGKALPLARILEILFLGTVGGSILGKVLSPGMVTLDKIFGALAAYLMAGLVLGLGCGVLELYVPGSFARAHGSAGPPGSDMIYFGYVTLTTLGYGDITPVTAKARSLAMLGAIFGPLYIAILVARLVGDFGSEVKPSRSDDPEGL